MKIFKGWLTRFLFHQFLYIDLFIIIPIAVTSELNHFKVISDKSYHCFSGPDITVSANPSEASDSKFGIEKGACKHYRTNHTYKRLSTVGFPLGEDAIMVIRFYTSSGQGFKF